MHELVIRNACPWGGGLAGSVDVAVDGGHITAVAPALPGCGRQEWEAGGRLLLPALVDPHHHLDKACLARELGGASDLADARARFASLRPGLTRESHIERGSRVVEWAIRHGVSALRTHADVDRVVGLRHVEAALELKSNYAGRIAIQVVAFQPAGVPVDDEESWRRLAEALRIGCDAAGGTTGNRGGEAPRVMERVVRLAAGAQCMVDLHLDETLDPATQNLAELARLARRYGLEGRVAASHCCSLSVATAAQRAEAIGLAAEARIHVIALPLTNLYLQGRDSGLRGIAPVAELLAGGVNVACGSDNVQDPFLPAGNADPLLAAQLLGIAAQLPGPESLLEAVTWRAGRVLGLAAGRDWCHPAAPASFSVADCGPREDPVACLAPRPLCVYEGRVVRTPEECAPGLLPVRERA
ncbi:MAG: amidohydrolase family protein [Burkholderiales bacterium]|nr:amidohydrolase family protein [Burkholderiales bacterium]